MTTSYAWSDHPSVGWQSFWPVPYSRFNATTAERLTFPVWRVSVIARSLVPAPLASAYIIRASADDKAEMRSVE